MLAKYRKLTLSAWREEGKPMNLSDSFGKRTTNIFQSAIRHRFYLAGAATALPVFFIASGGNIFGQNGNGNLNNSPASKNSPLQPNEDSLPNPSSPGQSDENAGSNTQASSADDNSNHTSASASINGQTINASTDGTSNQSIHKSLNTDNGSANISIDQQRSTAYDGSTNTTSNVSVNSSSSSSDSQQSEGGTAP
jgi:hypothetical protein